LREGGDEDVGRGTFKGTGFFEVVPWLGIWLFGSCYEGSREAGLTSGVMSDVMKTRVSILRMHEKKVDLLDKEEISTVLEFGGCVLASNEKVTVGVCRCPGGTAVQVQ